jgi:hypothetical protein
MQTKLTYYALYVYALGQTRYDFTAFGFVSEPEAAQVFRFRDMSLARHCMT